MQKVCFMNGGRRSMALVVLLLSAMMAFGDTGTKTFRRVSSTESLEAGLHCVIACGSQSVAAGAQNGTYLSGVGVTISNDVITIKDNVAVFVLGEGSRGWTFQNEGTGQYLVSTTAKNVTYSSTAGEWTLADGTNGVALVAGEAGTMLYNVSSPRFTTYTNDPTDWLIAAELYVEDGGSAGLVVPKEPTVSDNPTVPTASANLSASSLAYYKNANGNKGEALKTAMYKIISNKTNSPSYDDLLELYKITDTRPDGKVRDWYSNTTNFTHIKDKAGSYRKEGDVYNREHTVPQSWGPPKADIVHVVPTDGYVNNRRSNYPFGEVGSVTYQSNNGYSKLGSCKTAGYSGTVFEPNDEVKGDIARIYFYMATCYEGQAQGWSGGVFGGTKYKPFAEWTYKMMMRWSKLDPVDDVERARNDSIAKPYVQGNRNPFVDYPGLEEYIWGSLTDVAFSYDHYVEPDNTLQYVTMSFSPASVTATIGEDFTEPTLTTNPAGLAVTYASSAPSVATVNETTGEVTLVAAGVTTITAIFAGNDNYNSGTASYTLTVKRDGQTPTPDPTPGLGHYALVTDASTLAAGDRILITYINGNDKYVLSTKQNLNNRTATTDVTVHSDGTLTPGDAAQIITLEKEGGNYLFNVGDGYLYAAGGGNCLRTEQNANDNAKATISISYGDAAIVFQGSSTQNIIRFNPNNGNPLFSCYASSSSVKDEPQIYRELPIPSIVLGDESAGNSSIIATNASKTANVTLSGRTLYKDGEWNTLCLPFDVTLEGSPLAGATAKTLTDATMTGTHITLTFGQAVTTLKAGTPYLIKWGSDEGEDIVNPVFTGVTIDSRTDRNITKADGHVSFIGYYDAFTVTPSDDYIYYMTAGNQLKHTAKERVLKACRAYFQFSDEAKSKPFVLDFAEENSATGIAIVGSATAKEKTGDWYTINGVRIEKPVRKGLYILNGQKVVIK